MPGGSQGIAKFFGCGACCVAIIMIIALVSTIQIYEVENYSGCTEDYTSEQAKEGCEIEDAQCALSYFAPAKVAIVGCMPINLCNSKITANDITDETLRAVVKATITAEGYSSDLGIAVYCGWQASVF